MTWTRLNDGWNRDPAIAGLPRDARLFWVDAVTYCNEQLTDGFLSDDVLSLASPGIGRKRIESWAKTCEIRGVFVRDLDQKGWWIRNFLKYNPTKKQVLAAQEARRAKSRNAANSRWNSPEEERDASCLGACSEHGPSICSEDASRARSPGPARPVTSPTETAPDAAALTPSAPVVPTATEPEQKPQEPVKPKASKSPKQPSLPGTLKPKQDQSEFWACWRNLWSERWGQKYVDCQGDGTHMAAVIKLAKERAFEKDSADKDLAIDVFAYWVERYLSEDGDNGFLCRRKHPLRSLARDLQAYGLPWDRPTERVRRSSSQEPEYPQHRLLDLGPRPTPEQERLRIEASKVGLANIAEVLSNG